MDLLKKIRFFDLNTARGHRSEKQMTLSGLTLPARHARALEVVPRVVAEGVGRARRGGAHVAAPTPGPHVHVGDGDAGLARRRVEVEQPLPVEAHVPQTALQVPHHRDQLTCGQARAHWVG